MTSVDVLLDEAIADLEARLNLKPGEPIPGRSNETNSTTATTKSIENSNNKKNKKEKQSKVQTTTTNNTIPAEGELPDICKLEFKVGVITKVWVHETADKLYCEEIDVGEETPRQIASGLRSHFTLEQMLGQRLLVICNLKPKNLVGFKSHGMVLCAAEEIEETTIGSDEIIKKEHVEFVEPPINATIGEIITFDQLPIPKPLTPNQIEKQKIFQNCLNGMKSNNNCQATWNGHLFLTSSGPCTTKTIKNGSLR